MIVTRAGFTGIVNKLMEESRLAIDTETTGLRMYHGDRLFSVIIASATDVYYFNFNPFDFSHSLSFGPVKIPLEDEVVLTREHLHLLRPLFDRVDVLWFIHNAANFDLCIFGVENIEFAGTIHCERLVGRLIFNEHNWIKYDPKKKALKPYSLAAQLHRIGLFKTDAVAAYVTEHKLKTLVDIPGKDTKSEQHHYDRVPLKLMQPYGENDGTTEFSLGSWQLGKLQELDAEEPNFDPSVRGLARVYKTECRLQKTIFRMKHKGVRIDKPYCERASAEVLDRGQYVTAVLGGVR